MGAHPPNQHETAERGCGSIAIKAPRVMADNCPKVTFFHPLRLGNWFTAA